MRSPPRMLAVAGAVAALAVCAWFALSLRQAHAIDRATAIVQSGGPLTRQDAQQAHHQLHVAGQLNPDQTVTVLRAELAARVGDHAQAERLLKQVVAAEPENAEAWEDLAQVATDGPTQVESYIRLHHLVAGKL